MEQLTIFYLKDTGAIKYYCTGVQDMNYFGDNKSKKELTIDFVVVDNDRAITDNKENFYVDLETKELKRK